MKQTAQSHARGFVLSVGLLLAGAVEATELMVGGDGPLPSIPFGAAPPTIVPLVRGLGTPSAAGIIQTGKIGDVPSPLRSSTAALWHGGKLYVAGGHQGVTHTYPPDGFSSDFHVYDPLEADIPKQWKRLASRPFAAQGYQIAANGNFIYAFGGMIFSPDHRIPPSPQCPGFLRAYRSIDFIDRYDIANNTWATLHDAQGDAKGRDRKRLATPRSSYALAVVGTKAYLLGGWNSTPRDFADQAGQFLDSIEAFDFSTEQVETIDATLPRPLRRAFATATNGDDIILVGGLGVKSFFDLVDRVTVFSPKAIGSPAAWRELRPLPSGGAFAPGAVVIDGKLYVIGGLWASAQPPAFYSSEVMRLDLRTGTGWDRNVGNLPEGRGFPQVVKNDQGEGLIVGGHYGYACDPVKDHPINSVVVLAP